MSAFNREVALTDPASHEVSDNGLQQLCASLVIETARLLQASRALSTGLAGSRTLAVLERAGPSSITALAAADNVSQPTMSATIRALNEQGLVTTSLHSTDGRSKLVAVTPAGLAVLARFRSELGAALASRLGTAGDPIDHLDIIGCIEVISEVTRRVSALPAEHAKRDGRA